MASGDGPSRRDVIRTATGGLALALSPNEAGAAGSVAKIMIIRHAEKPADDGTPPPGIGADGEQDRHALLVRGWQRAGALARFFAPRDGRLADPALVTPAAIIAAAPVAGHRSERSVLTVGPLAALLGIAPDTRFGPDGVRDAAAAALAATGPVLIAWEHKRIADLVGAVTSGAVAPPRWSGKRFDIVLVLDREPAGWRLTQVPQMLLAGDSAEPLRPGAAGEAPD